MKNGWIHEYSEWKGSYVNHELDMVLYRLCQENPKHVDKNMVRAKFVIVNRVYAAGAERHVKDEIQEEIGCIEPYVQKLAELSTKLDPMLNELRKKFLLAAYKDSFLDAYKGNSVSSPETVSEIVEVHGWLNTQLQDVTRNEVSLRSFVSKYLHFHVPIFPIYDSNAKTVIEKEDWYPWDKEWNEKYGVCPSRCDEEYWRFCVRIAKIVEQWPYGRHLPPTSRNIDRLLMKAAFEGWYTK